MDQEDFMLLKKCCFVIDRDFINIHHGCRRYLFGMSKIFSSLGFESDFLMLSKGSFECINFSEQDKKNNGYNDNTCVGRTKDEILLRLKKEPKIVYEAPSIDISCVTEIEKRNNKQYDICVLGGPWIFDKAEDLPLANKYFCVAHDIVPNRNYFSEPNNFGLLMFAYAHAKGYKYFSTYGNGLITTTNTVAEQLVEYGFAGKNQVFTMPLFLPVGYDEEIAFTNRRRNGVVLAAPFDIRKGMDVIPSILNDANVDKLYIFGRPRCDLANLIEWFESLKLTNVEWWVDVNLAKQQELYSSAKVLLFPSYQEGLGLPILEATACGTSPLVRNKNPMNQLVPDQMNIANDNSEFVERLSYLLSDDIDFAKKNIKYSERYKVSNLDMSWLMRL